MRITKTKGKALAEPIKTGNVDSVLSSLFRSIMFNIHMDNMKFSRLMDKYIIKAGITYNTKESTSVKGNLKKELLSEKMSWKVFIKGLVFLNVYKFDLTIRLYHSNDITTEHTKTVLLISTEDDDDIKKPD